LTFARLLRTTLGVLSSAGTTADASELGNQGENLAYWHLREQGFTVVARNYRYSGGEVDLIAWEGDTLVFVEVKSRGSGFRAPEDAVDREKRRHLVAAARDYRYRAHVRSPYRFDVISILLEADRQPLIQHFRNAFDEAEATSGQHRA
jgi:putative endonuclease